MRRKKDTKKRIYEAAAALFNEKGFVGASMRDLADRVGIEPSSIYSHVSGKEALLEKICLDTAETFCTEAAYIVKTIPDPVDQIVAIIALHYKLATEDPSSATVFTDEWRHLSSESMAQFEALRRQYQRQVKAILLQGMEVGVFHPSDIGISLKTLLTSLRWLHVWPGKLGPEALEQITAYHMRALVRGRE